MGGGLVEVGELIGARFARYEPRANALEYVRGLLSHEERKNSWTLSERAGQQGPGPDAVAAVDHGLGTDAGLSGRVEGDGYRRSWVSRAARPCR